MDYKLLAEDFAKKLTQSDIYVNYLKANEELNKNSDLKKQIDEYRLSLVKMQMARDGGAFVSDEEQVKVSGLYSQLLLTEGGADFLEKERKLVKMLKDVTETVYKSVPMDLGFLQ